MPKRFLSLFLTYLALHAFAELEHLTLRSLAGHGPWPLSPAFTMVLMILVLSEILLRIFHR